MRVMVVDDRPENIYLLTQLLKARGYEIEEAANGREALKKLRQKKFDLIISDIMMPEMDGFEFCRLVKTEDALKEIPLVFYTATYTDPQDEALGLSTGASAFIVKPVEPDAFLVQIDEVLRKTAQGKVLPHLTPSEEKSFLKQYSERLVHKLEDKTAELETKNEQLSELTRTLEQRVRAAVKDLEERNRELEAFTSWVSHDLQAPLRAINAFAKVLLSETEESLSGEHRHHLERIASSAGDMERLITDLLGYSRLSRDEIPLSSVSLETVIDRAIQHLSTRLEESNGRIHVQKPMPVVRAFEPVLVQVFTNLFDNAIKFIADETAPFIEVISEEKDGRIRIIIRDNGIGILPEYQERIFGMFERLNAEKSGHGIGLAMVRKGIERMGGSITVQSKPGEGSSFTIELAKG